MLIILDFYLTTRENVVPVTSNFKQHAARKYIAPRNPLYDTIASFAMMISRSDSILQNRIYEIRTIKTIKFQEGVGCITPKERTVYRYVLVV